MRTVFPYQIEDRLKAEFFAGSPPGYFVEVGASEPQCGSQSWQFEQAGWAGVLIEPNITSLCRSGSCATASAVGAIGFVPDCAGADAPPLS